MIKFLGMILMTLSLTVTSAVAMELCAENHQGKQAGQVSKTPQDHKAFAGHHCACQHVMADQDVLPASTYVRAASNVSGIVSTQPVYFSLSHGPLLEPPSRA